MTPHTLVLGSNAAMIYFQVKGHWLIHWHVREWVQLIRINYMDIVTKPSVVIASIFGCKCKVDYLTVPPLLLLLQVHGLKETALVLTETSQATFSQEQPLSIPPAGFHAVWHRKPASWEHCSSPVCAAFDTLGTPSDPSQSLRHAVITIFIR